MEKMTRTMLKGFVFLMNGMSDQILDIATEHRDKGNMDVCKKLERTIDLLEPPIESLRAFLGMNKERPITKDEVYEYMHTKEIVTVHLMDTVEGGDKDFKGLVEGCRNANEGFQACVCVGEEDYWLPLNRIFVTG